MISASTFLIDKFRLAVQILLTKESMFHNCHKLQWITWVNNDIKFVSGNNILFFSSDWFEYQQHGQRQVGINDRSLLIQNTTAKFCSNKVKKTIAYLFVELISYWIYFEKNNSKEWPCMQVHSLFQKKA